jgi:DNA (cytosine-5)-methyltransferase 1
LWPGKAIEFARHSCTQNEFLYIKQVLRHVSTGEIILRGLLCHRVGQLAGMVKNDINELVFFREVDKDDSRPKNYQSMVEVSLENVVRNRKIVFTNEAFPRYSFYEDTPLDADAIDYKIHRKTIKDTSVLVCRFVYTEFYCSAAARKSNRKYVQATLRRIYHDESGIGPSIDIDSKKQAPSSREGDTLRNHASRKRPIPTKSIKARPITYGSGCAGAGGDSMGALLAGFTIKYGWDRNSPALRAFLLNHKTAVVYETEATDFTHKDNPRQAICHHLHLSWPCQRFSPAHTIEGPEDNANEASIFGTYEKLMSSGAFIHTQENTSGLLTHHPMFFCALIEQIIRAGYNVAWKVVQLRDFGIAQSRNRLIIIAAK